MVSYLITLSDLCCLFSRSDSFQFLNPLFSLPTDDVHLACFPVFSDPGVSDCMNSSGMVLSSEALPLLHTLLCSLS